MIEFFAPSLGWVPQASLVALSIAVFMLLVTKQRVGVRIWRGFFILGSAALLVLGSSISMGLAIESKANRAIDMIESGEAEWVEIDGSILLRDVSEDGTSDMRLSRGFAERLVVYLARSGQAGTSNSLALQP